MDEATKVDLKIIAARSRWAYDDLIADHLCQRINRVSNLGNAAVLDFIGGRRLRTVTTLREEVLARGHVLPLIDTQQEWEAELDRILEKEIWVLDVVLFHHFQLIYRWACETLQRSVVYLIRIHGNSKEVVRLLRWMESVQRGRGKSSSFITK